MGSLHSLFALPLLSASDAGAGVDEFFNPANAPPEGAPLAAYLAIASACVVGFAALYFWVTAKLFKPGEDKAIATSTAGTRSQPYGDTGSTPLPRPYSMHGQTDYGMAGIDLLVLLLLYIGINALSAPYAASVISGYRPNTGASAHTHHYFLVLLAAISLVTPVLFLSLRRRRKDLGIVHFAFKPALPKLPRTLVMEAAWLPFALSLQWAMVFALWLWGHTMQEQEVLQQLTEPSPLQWPAAILTAVVAAPVVEELVFRAGFQGFARRYMGFWPAVIVATVLFVLPHLWRDDGTLQVHFALPVAGLGFALGWAYERSRNIWIPIALHALHNGLTLAVTTYLIGA